MDISPINASLSIRDGHLFIEECDTQEIVRQFGSPLFVVSENHLRQNFRNYQSTFSQFWPEGPVRIMPSVKASPVISIQKILVSEGAGCDVFGPGELEAAIRSKVAPELISVNGSIKDREIIHRAISVGATIVLDSPRELELCNQVGKELNKAARVMFRLKPYLRDLNLSSDYVPGRDIKTLTQNIKYGIPTSELISMARSVSQMAQIDPVGVHVHIGRHSKKTEMWRSWVDNCIRLTKRLSNEMGDWQPSQINLGGGFPSAPDQDTDVTVKGYPGPSLTEIAQVITSTLRTALKQQDLKTDGVTLMLEPGRGIHCDTGIHLTTVRNLKHETENIEHRWAEVDTSQMFLGIGGANFDEPKFEFIVANKAGEEASSVTDIVGKTCNLEILYYQTATPPLEIDDTIALLNTGSYIETCAQNFNALPRPGVVLVNGGNAHWIKRPESVDDVFARDVIIPD